MTFEGFPKPTKNFFSMPNAITDIIAEITNMAELKVIIYVIRHTWGFHEYGKPKAISVDEFMNGRRFANGTRMDKGTGLSHHSVIDGCKRAVDHGYLICEIDDSDMARVKKSFALKMISTSEDATPGEEFAPPEEFAPGAESSIGGAESASGSADSAPPMEDSAPRSEKDTIRNTHKKHTEEKQESAYPAVESSATSATAFADRDAHTQDENGSHSPLQDVSETKERTSTTTAAAPTGKAAAPSEKPAKRAGGRKSTKAAEPEFTPEGRKVYDAWASLFKSPPDAGPKTILCANALYEKLMPWCYELKLTCKELLSDIKDWLFANQGDYYHGRGVKLCDVGREFEGWQSAKQDEMSNPNRPAPTPRKSSTRATSAAKDEDMVMWWDQQTGQQRLMTYAEADENGWEGGFGEFIQHTNYGRTVTA